MIWDTQFLDTSLKMWVNSCRCFKRDPWVFFRAKMGEEGLQGEDWSISVETFTHLFKLVSEICVCHKLQLDDKPPLHKVQYDQINKFRGIRRWFPRGSLCHTVNTFIIIATYGLLWSRVGVAGRHPRLLWSNRQYYSVCVQLNCTNMHET